MRIEFNKDIVGYEKLKDFYLIDEDRFNFEILNKELGDKLEFGFNRIGLSTKRCAYNSVYCTGKDSFSLIFDSEDYRNPGNIKEKVGVKVKRGLFGEKEVSIFR